MIQSATTNTSMFDSFHRGVDCHIQTVVKTVKMCLYINTNIDINKTIVTAG